MSALINLFATIVWGVPVIFFLIEMRKRRHFASAIWFALALKSLWVGLSVYLSSFFLDFSIESDLGISEAEVLHVLMIELFYSVIIYVVLAFGMQAVGFKGDTMKPLISSGADVAFAFFVIAIFLYLCLFHFVTISDLGAEGNEGAEVSKIAALAGLLYTIFFGAGILISSVALVRQDASRLFKAVSLLSLSLLGAWRVIAGLRGSLVLLALIVCFAGLIATGRARYLVYFACLCLVTVPFFGFMGSTMRETTRAVSAERLSLVDKITLFSNSAKAENVLSTKGFLDSVESLSFRLQDVRNSVSLIRLYDSDRGASYRPILGSSAVYVPRSFWPEKIFQSSVGPEYNSSAKFLVMRETYGEPLSYIAEFGSCLLGRWVDICGGFCTTLREPNYVVVSPLHSLWQRRSGYSSMRTFWFKRVLSTSRSSNLLLYSRLLVVRSVFAAAWLVL